MFQQGVGSGENYVESRNAWHKEGLNCAANAMEFLIHCQTEASSV